LQLFTNAVTAAKEIVDMCTPAGFVRLSSDKHAATDTFPFRILCCLRILAGVQIAC
jgi:hypothetical protein